MKNCVGRNEAWVWLGVIAALLVLAVAVPMCARADQPPPGSAQGLKIQAVSGCMDDVGIVATIAQEAIGEFRDDFATFAAKIRQGWEEGAKREHIIDLGRWVYARDPEQIANPRLLGKVYFRSCLAALRNRAGLASEPHAPDYAR